MISVIASKSRATPKHPPRVISARLTSSYVVLSLLVATHRVAHRLRSSCLVAWEHGWRGLIALPCKQKHVGEARSRVDGRVGEARSRSRAGESTIGEAQSRSHAGESTVAETRSRSRAGGNMTGEAQSRCYAGANQADPSRLIRSG